MFFDFFIGEAGKRPDVPTELIATEIGNFLTGFGLDKWFSATESDARLTFKGL